MEFLFESLMMEHESILVLPSWEMNDENVEMIATRVLGYNSSFVSSFFSSDSCNKQLGENSAILFFLFLCMEIHRTIFFSLQF